jgi:hypothetical protein
LQILDVDRDGLTKLKKAVKALHASGNGKFEKSFASLSFSLSLSPSLSLSWALL